MARLLARFVAGCTAAVAAAAAAAAAASLQLEWVPCHPTDRSNSTHLVWHASASTAAAAVHPTTTRMSSNYDSSQDDSHSSNSYSYNSNYDSNYYYYCQWQSVPDAKREAYEYLKANIMAFDGPFAQTLGFRLDNDSDDDESDDDDSNIDTQPPPDGLDQGVVQSSIEYAIRAKQQLSAAADAVPRAIWQAYVLSYANLNEARSSVRTVLWDRLVAPLLVNDTTATTETTTTNNNNNRSIAETVAILNANMWTLLAPRTTTTNNNSIVFVAGQTPAIFDSISVLVFGYASCTGLALLFVQALRTAGIPARVAGTAAWNGNATKGNHNWVEVWNFGQSKNQPEQEWSFLEPSPAQTIVDTIDRNPCDRWFCSPDRMVDTECFAATTAAAAATRPITNTNRPLTYFPLAWEWDNRDVPAVNRTLYYRSVCSQCGLLPGSAATTAAGVPNSGDVANSHSNAATAMN